MKRGVTRLLLGAAMVAAAAVAAAGSRAADSHPIIIGIDAPLSGAGASGAKPEVQGALLAVAEYNARGGYHGRKVKVNVLDDRSDPQTGLAVVQKLVNQNHAVSIVGSFYSAVAVAMNPLIQQSKVPYISDCSVDACTAPPAGGGTNYMFRCAFGQTAQVLSMVRYLKRPDVKAGIIYELSGFGIPAQQTTVKRAAAVHVSITDSEGVNVGALQMISELSKLRASGANTLVAWMLPPGLINLEKNLQTLNWHPTVISSYAATNPGFLTSAGSLANGMLVANAYTPGGSKAARAFEARYVKKYGPNPWPIISALYYDGTRLMLEALTKVGPNPQKIRDELQKIHDFEPITAMGSSPWRRNHDAVQPGQVFLSKIQDGKLIKTTF